MAKTLLDQLTIHIAHKHNGKYRTIETGNWLIPLNDEEATAARVIVLVENLETAIDSATVSAEILRLIQRNVIQPSDRGSVYALRQRLADTVQAANHWLFNRALESHKLGTLGASVMIALCVAGHRGVSVSILHVGKCRASLLRGDRHFQLTVEHTKGSDYVARTGASVSEAAGSGWRQATRFFGAAAEVVLDGFVDAPAPGGGPLARRESFLLEFNDLVLLSSASVRPATEEQMLPMVRTRTPSQLANDLIQSQSDYELNDRTAIVIKRGSTPSARRFGPLLAFLVVMVLALMPLLYRPSAPPALIALLAQLPERAALSSAAQITETATITAAVGAQIAAITATIAITEAPTTLPAIYPRSTTEPLINNSVNSTVATQLTPATAPSPTPTPVPAATATPPAAPPTPINTPTTVLSTLAPTLTAPPTATPTPTAPPAPPTATATAEVAPPPTPEPQTPESPTVTTATVEVTTTVTILPELPPLPDRFSITLGEPEADITASDRTQFTWSATHELPEGYEFELVLWRPGEDPVYDGKGWGGKSRASLTTINFSRLGWRAEQAGKYFWGVRLVRAEPYKVLQYSWGQRQIVVHLTSVEPTSTPCTTATSGDC